MNDDNSNDNPLAEAGVDLREGSRRSNAERIYKAIMQGGGVPFGRPFGVGVSTLTERIVKAFKQQGFFGFETLDTPADMRGRNKFTRYGASRFRGVLRRNKKSP